MKLLIKLVLINLINTIFFIDFSFSYDKEDLKTLLETNTCINCDLSDADLKKQNLSNANLKGSNLNRANLWRANLKNANLEGCSLEEANLKRVNLEKDIDEEISATEQEINSLKITSSEKIKNIVQNV